MGQGVPIFEVFGFKYTQQNMLYFQLNKNQEKQIEGMVLQLLASKLFRILPTWDYGGKSGFNLPQNGDGDK